MDGMRAVLDFWFDEASQPHWFKPCPAFDRAVAEQLGRLHARAAAGDFDAWQASANGCLALCILLDQVPRQLFRGQDHAFATDPQALTVAEQALAQGFDFELVVERRLFLYMPFMHSEQLGDQERCVALFEHEDLRDKLRHAVEHAEIVRRFGRFPHRNTALGRTCTAEEETYLRNGAKQFGQVALPAPD